MDAGPAAAVPVSVTRSKPKTTGAATAAIPAVANKSFPDVQGFTNMASQSTPLVSRLGPVTPATQLNGDSTQNAQTLRMPSA